MGPAVVILGQRQRIAGQLSRLVTIHPRVGTVAVHVHRTHRDDSRDPSALAQRNELRALGGGRTTRERVDDDLRTPALRRATAREELTPLAVEVLKVARLVRLMNAAVRQGDLVPRRKQVRQGRQPDWASTPTNRTRIPRP
jgi:hypothetical protein